MIDRRFIFFLVLFFSLCGLANAENKGIIYPIPEGMARLTIERAEEPLLYRQDALIALNGRPVGALSRGARLTWDLAPGVWRVSAKARASAEQAVLPVTLKANSESRVRIELDPTRFPQGSGVSGLGNLLRQSLDAPNDDRIPLFTIRLATPETPEVER